MMTNDAHTKKIRRRTTLLLVLWFVIVFGFFGITVLGHDCVARNRDCPIEFMDQVSSITTIPLLIQFVFFLFIPVVCEICIPDVISHAFLAPSFSAVPNPIKVVSPPPRSSH